MVLTWIGIVVMVVVMIMWVALENRRLVDYARRGLRGAPPKSPQPGMTGGEESEGP